MSCEYIGRCMNSEECWRCFDKHLLKLPKEKVKNRAMSNRTASTAMANDEDSWKNLEQETADALNDIPKIEEARRSRASGALWFEKGDVIDELVSPECKERQGNVLKGGDKSLSFKREWLTKAREEAQESDRTMILPFRFKSDPNTYIAMYSDDIYNLITTAKSFMHDNDIKDAQLKTVYNTIDQLKEVDNVDLLKQAIKNLKASAIDVDKVDGLAHAISKLIGEKI